MKEKAMTVPAPVMSYDDDAALAAMMAKAEEKSSSSDVKIIRLTSDLPLGTYRLRILPNGDMTSPQWWATYGTHYFKPLDPMTGMEDKNRKGKMFVCSDHTHDRECKICSSIAKVKNLYKDLEARDPSDPERAAQFPMVAMQYAAADEAYASPRILVNAMIIPAHDMTTQIAPVQLVQIPKGFRDELFKMARMISLRFFAADANLCWHVKIEKLANRKGNTPTLVGRENPVDLVGGGFDKATLHNLGAIVAGKIGNMNRAEAFNDDWFAMPTAPASLPAPGGMGLAALPMPGMIPGMMPGMVPGLALPGSLPAPSVIPTVAPAIVAPAVVAPVAPAVVAPTK